MGKASYLEFAGRWGYLPIALPCAAFIAARLGSLAFPLGPAGLRALAGSTLGAAFTLAVVHCLSLLHCLTGPALLAVGLAAATALAFVRTPARGPAAILGIACLPVVLVAIGAVAASSIAAYLLPVWQWDALGYHLPYVNFALAARSFDGVPDDVPYVSTYPHNVEDLTLALRALLPDDRLVDVAQIPFGVLGAVATAALARLKGASRASSAAAGAAWVVVPAVWLQLPTDYVDVACAAFLLASTFFVACAWRLPSPIASSPNSASALLLVAGVALGLLLGSKPNAPLSAAILASLLVAAGLRARRPGVTALALSLALALGARTFVANALRYGNPVWPVAVSFGHLVHLPGTSTVQSLLDSGVAAPRVTGPLPRRVLLSWTSLCAPPVFDMRIGGFGPLFLAALGILPVAIVRCVRERDVVSAGALVAALATPDPAVARFVLALPALVFALAAPYLDRLAARTQRWVHAAIGAAAAFQVAYAWPGLTGEGPPLSAYVRMSDAERAVAVGANGPPTSYVQARKRVGPGETFAFDRAFDLPYLAWPADLATGAVWVPDSLAGDAVEDFLERNRVRVAVASETSPLGEWLRRRPERFERLFPCKSTSCSVYARR